MPITTLGNQWVMKLLLSLSSVAVAIVLAAPAHADTKQDEAFVAAVRSAGITVKNPDDAIVTGKAVCVTAQAGKPTTDLVKELQELNPELPPVAAAKFTALATSAYCPDQLPGAKPPKGGGS
jgi:hypothetical protein